MLLLMTTCIKSDDISSVVVIRVLLCRIYNLKWDNTTLNSFDLILNR